MGFEDKYQAMVARFVNNGTAGMSQKKVKNMHFIEKAQNEAKNEMLKAEAEKYKEVFVPIFNSPGMNVPIGKAK